MAEATEIVEETWEPCPLFIGPLSAYRGEHVIDIMKCGVRQGTKPAIERPGRSRKVMEASNRLAADPYNLRLIHDLGAAYASEGQWEKAANVMLRGWKRADEMTDDKIRFRFLMKLCEASFRISKPRQAFAVLNSMSGAPDNSDIAALHAMSVQVYCAVGDVQKALSTFKKAISGQEYQDALTLLALVAEDLRAAKAFHPVRDAVKALKPKQDMQLGIIEHYVEAKDKQEQEEKTLAYKLASPKLFIGVVATVMFLLSLYLMFLLEQWSLKKWSIQK